MSLIDEFQKIVESAKREVDSLFGKEDPDIPPHISTTMGLPGDPDDYPDEIKQGILEDINEDTQ